MPARTWKMGGWLLLAAVTVAAGPAPSPTPAPTAVPATDAAAREFLAVAQPLITPVEREIYLSLRHAYQRRAFESRFWRERDPFPETAANEFADPWRKRAPAAIERWGSLEDARALAYTAAGEPASTLRVACPDFLRPAEIWRYDLAGRVRNPFVVVFVAKSFSERSEYRAWDPHEGVFSLAMGTGATRSSPMQLLQSVADHCTRGGEIASLLDVAVDWNEVMTRGELMPHPNDEWAHSFSTYSTDLPAGAKTLPAALDLAFPGRHGLRTRVEGAIRLGEPPSAKNAYTVDGEVLRGDELFDHFRYRFEAAPGATTPFVFERPLRPGDYHLIVKLHELDDDRYFRDERDLEVPVVGADGTLLATARAKPEAPATPAIDAGAPDTAPEPSLRLVIPGGDRLLTGRARVEAVTQGDDIAAVGFTLDGKPIMRKLRPPFDVELDLGPNLRLHRVGAVAYDGFGTELARDETLVNGGPHRFALRLTDPQNIPPGAERVVARAQVDVPVDETLDRVEFYVDDKLYATLYQPPFAQSLPVPAGTKLAWIRAVAYLVDGDAAEDVKLIGAGDLSTAVQVDFVELYASVLDRRGRPIDDLKESEVEVREDGKKQQIRRFEKVADLPIHAGVLLDTSASMAEELQRGGERGAPFLLRGTDRQGPRHGHHFRRRASRGGAIHPQHRGTGRRPRPPRGRRRDGALGRPRLCPPLLQRHPRQARPRRADRRPRLEEQVQLREGARLCPPHRGGDLRRRPARPGSPAGSRHAAPAPGARDRRPLLPDRSCGRPRTDLSHDRARATLRVLDRLSVLQSAE